MVCNTTVIKRCIKLPYIKITKIGRVNNTGFKDQGRKRENTMKMRE